MPLSPEIERLLTRFDTITDTYLREEVNEALARREEITPHLLAIVDEVADNPVRCALEQRNSHVYAAALLAHFHEPAAHAPLIRAFSIPQEELDFLWGDMVTESLPILLHQTSDGSVERIKQLINNREIDQYVRVSAAEALTFAVADGALPREEAVAYVQSLFSGQEAEPGSSFWGLLAGLLCDLHPADSMDVIKRAYNDDLIDSRIITLEDVERAESRTMTETMEVLRRWKESRTPEDVHGYLAWFGAFQSSPADRLDRLPSPAKGGGKNRQEKNKKKANRAKNKEAKKARKKHR